MKKYLIAISIIITSTYAMAQEHWCGFSLRNSQMDSYVERVNNIFANRANQLRPDCLNKTLSIHLHIIGENSDDQYINADSIYANIDSLNKAFEPICLSFEVCKTEYHNNSVYNEGLIDTNYARVYRLYADSGVINIFYVVNFDDENMKGVSFHHPERFFAMASINHRALIHEMGHYLGLVHTNETTGEFVDRSNCDSAGDYICDTEADPGFGESCEYNYSQTDINGDYYTPPLYNYMTQWGNKCGVEFTPMQYLIMIDCVLNQRTYLH
jgi:hypothetical protein